MDEPHPPDGAGVVSAGPHQRVLNETARALAESDTLSEAAPGLLKAVCEALGWQYGALWEVDRTRNVLRSVGYWQSPSLPSNEFAEITLATAE